MNTKVHIVSHSHWDREWYMQFEQYHMKLIDLIDDVLNQVENDKDFDSFHLDGQMIIIDDYLSVRPENKERLTAAINNGKIKIGPWYVAQDCYLTSSEANVRNLQIGTKAAAEYNITNYVGYFPDTFGFPLQTIQMYKQAGIDTLVFGRGVFTAQDEHLNKSQSRYSELLLEAPNGEQILAVLLSNWYNNGLEIPSEKQAAKVYWDQKLADARKDASTRHLLFMNGSDHQPLQTDISQAIAIANELYPDVEFVHTSLEQYISEMKAELDYSKLSVLDEEIKQQYTDGMYYLTGTASSRVSTKQLNFETQNLIEKELEPLQLITGMTDLGKNQYIWKLLMQNHAHDSICGCTIDDVNHSVVERFNSVKAAANEQLRNINNTIKSQLNSEENSFSLTNPSVVDCEQYIELEVNYNVQEFNDQNLDSIRKLVTTQGETKYWLQSDGQKVESIIDDLGVNNCYQLPQAKFRKSMLCRKLKIAFVANIPAGTTKVFKIENGSEAANAYQNEREISNQYYTISIDNNFNLLNKTTNQTTEKFIELVDCGDIGNTFMFGNVEDDQPINFDFSQADVKSIKNSSFEQLIISANIKLPISAEVEKISEERRTFTMIDKRVSKRDVQLVDNPIEIKVTLNSNTNNIDFKIKFINNSLDHRLRAVFTTNENITSVNAGTIFEQVKREPIINHGYKLSNNQHQFERVMQADANNQTYTVATKGLYEYEVEQPNKLGITLIRAVGEMGDWLFFETPDAQLLGEQNFELSIAITDIQGKNEQLIKGYNYYNPLHVIELEANSTANAKTNYFPKLDNNSVIITSLKADANNQAVIRGFALADTTFEYANKQLRALNILEQPLEGLTSKVELKKNQIFTIQINDFM